MPGDPDGAARALEEWKTAHPSPRATLQQVADHIDHIRKTAGIDYIGIGSDFDGIKNVPLGLEDVSRYPDLLVELLRRGYSDQDIRKITGLNVLRAMKKAEAVAAQLQKDSAPSDALIEEVDQPH
jgi:membrane dipeptidase